MSKVSINESTLTAIGNAIRAKTGKSALIAPGAMPTEIASIETGGGGGGIEVEPIVISDTNGEFSCGGIPGGKYIELYGNSITTTNLYNTRHMFAGCIYKKPTFPFELNMTILSEHSLNHMFYKADMDSIPKMNNVKPDSINNLFADCLIKYLPDGWGSDWDWSYFHNATYSSCSTMFSGCRYLRRIPEYLLKNLYNQGTGTTYAAVNTLCQMCYVLDEVKNMAVQPTITSNALGYTVSYCGRLKDFTFAVNDDGTPKVANWKKQSFNMTNNVGYLSDPYYALSAGLTEETRVIDDASYQALKNHPDWWTTDAAYSRFNHDSAVNTLNSLPDVSANTGNAISFYGISGSKTDGGAINTLTEEEIAVATAKGWTVSLA